MKNLFMCLILTLFISCEGDGGGGSSSTSSPLDGNTYYLGVVEGSSGDILIDSFKIEGDQIKGLTLYAPEGRLTTVYYTKKEGRYSISGDIYSVTWEEETCDPVGSQEFEIKSSDINDRIFVKEVDDIRSYSYLNENKYPPQIDENQIVSLVEDVLCNQIP